MTKMLFINRLIDYFSMNLLLFIIIIASIIIHLPSLTTSKIINKNLSNDFYTLDLKMPGVLPTKSDSYFCTATNVSAEELYITRFEPNANSQKIHHIIIFGCKDILSKQNLYPNSWSCSYAKLCQGMQILYAWGRNAPNLALPKNVGFHIGQRSEVNYLILQAHYSQPLSEKDSSGVKLVYSLIPQPYVAGIFLMASSTGVIPPNKPVTHVDVNCRLNRDNPIFLFAYRVHAHQLGTVVVGYKYSSSSSSSQKNIARGSRWTELARGNPQWPQAFFPMQDVIPVESGDILFARCTYNSSKRSTMTRIGPKSTDEMCNLYLMYFSENKLLTTGGAAGGGGTEDLSGLAGLPFFIQSRKRPFKDSCQDQELDNLKLTRSLPKDSDKPLPRNVTMELAASSDSDSQNHHYHHSHFGAFGESSFSSISGNGLDPDQVESKPIQFEQSSNSPFGTKMFGQITAIDVDPLDGNVMIFHRGSHVWNGMSFDYRNNYRLINDGPINDHTIVVLDPRTWKIVDRWASGLFYLPHGLTIDRTNNAVWLTDVAMHQIFKFSLLRNSTDYRTKPLLTLGERFVAGSDVEHFCKPTSVAVDTVNNLNEIYVADGYCNSRVIRFNAKGVYQGHWGHSAPVQNNLFAASLGGGDSSLSSYSAPPNMLNIPHKVVLVNNYRADERLACVADRENGRVQCFTIPYGQFRFQIQRPEFNGRLFSIAYSASDRILYAVCGPSLTDSSRDIASFAFDIDTQTLVAMFAPNSGTFSQPHDIAVSSSGNSVFVVEIGPNNIWKFSKPLTSDDDRMAISASSISPIISGNKKVSSSKTEPSQPMIVKASKMIDTKLNQTFNGLDADTRFSFELLQIRSKQFRESLTFNSMLYFILFALALFIMILLYRYSSPNYTIFTFAANMLNYIRTQLCCPDGSGSGHSRHNRRSRRRKASSSNGRLSNGTSNGATSGEKYNLTNIFGDRERKLKRSGFERLPQNEDEELSEIEIENGLDEEEDEEDDLSDVIEDFTNNHHHNNNKKNKSITGSETANSRLV